MAAVRLTRPGLSSSIGSLPHTDAADAAAFVLAVQPGLPAAPSLPARHPAEGMLGQAASGVPGVTVEADGSLAVDRRALDPEAPITTGIDGEAFGGLRAFLHAVGGRTEPIKLQLTGPVTFGVALHRAGVPPAVAFAVAEQSAHQRINSLLDAAAEAAPAAPIVLFVDEPGLTGAIERGFPIAPDRAIDLVSGALAVVGPLAVTGVHCCGPTDWPLLLQAGPQILSITVEDAAALSGAELAPFLERGGWVAWGAVPTDGPVGTSADRLWRSLSERWCELVRGGCDPVLLRTQAMITPTCGLARHGTTQATSVLRLANDVAERLKGQALGVRLSVGA